jgi:hypothetical protein
LIFFFQIKQMFRQRTRAFINSYGFIIAHIYSVPFRQGIANKRVGLNFETDRQYGTLFSRRLAFVCNANTGI